jgi:hypothetical protein
VPIEFTAATRKVYEEPLASPVTVAVVPADTPSGNVVHAPSGYGAYWTA